MFLLTSMMAFAFSLEDEDDEDYKPRVVTKSVERKIAKFPDISAFGPKSIGALKILHSGGLDQRRANLAIAMVVVEAVVG